jgi:hypothetical protein
MEGGWNRYRFQPPSVLRRRGQVEVEFLFLGEANEVPLVGERLAVVPIHRIATSV